MLYWAVALFVVGLLATLLGFGNIAGGVFAATKGLVFLKVVGIILVLAGVGMLANSLGGTERTLRH